MSPMNDNSILAKVTVGNFRRKFARFENSHANVRILKFILEANRNSLRRNGVEEVVLFQGRSFQTAAQLKLTRGTIKGTAWKAPLVSKLANIIAVQTTRDLPSGSSERDKRNQRACSTHNYTLLKWIWSRRNFQEFSDDLFDEKRKKDSSIHLFSFLLACDFIIFWFFYIISQL